jgi:hypothetical protein
MLDQFRGKLALEILENLFERYHSSGRISSLRFESWDRVSPDLRVSRQEFHRILEKVTSFKIKKSFDSASYLDSLQEKVLAVSSKAETPRIIEKISELFRQAEAPRVVVEDSQVQERYECQKATEEKGPSPQKGSDPPFDLDKAFLQGDLELRQQALGHLVRENRLDYLEKVLSLEKEDPDPFIKVCSLRLLAQAESQHHEKIYDYLEDDEPRVIATAIEALETIGGSRALARISTFANHLDNRVRANALKALHDLDKQQSLALFNKMIDSKYSAYRDSAAYAICTLRNSEFIPHLERLLQDSSESVRTKAYHGLSYLAFQGDEKAREILNRMDSMGA